MDKKKRYEVLGIIILTRSVAVKNEAEIGPYFQLWFVFRKIMKSLTKMAMLSMEWKAYYPTRNLVNKFVDCESPTFLKQQTLKSLDGGLAK